MLRPHLAQLRYLRARDARRRAGSGRRTRSACGSSLSDGTRPGISLQPLARLGASTAAGSRRAGRSCTGAAARANRSSTGASSALRPGVHDEHAVGDVGDDAEVVRDQRRSPCRAARGCRASGRGSRPGSSRRAPSSARRRSSTFGSHASAIAIITRCRMPPESWCGYSPSRRSGAGMLHELEQLDRPRASPSRRESSRCRRSTSPIWSPTVKTGLSDVIGSWKTNEISRPRTSPQPPRRQRRAGRCRRSTTRCR